MMADGAESMESYGGVPDTLTAQSQSGEEPAELMGNEDVVKGIWESNVSESACTSLSDHSVGGTSPSNDGGDSFPSKDAPKTEFPNSHEECANLMISSVQQSLVISENDEGMIDAGTKLGKRARDMSGMQLFDIHLEEK